MFLNSWSLGLTLCSLIVLFLGLIASRTALRVLLHWNPASDSNQQIRLENETWLASTLVAYGLGFQIIMLVLFVLAADHYCQVIVGAMCATGALLANQWGIPTLIVKIGGVFLYGFWIVMHQIDIRSEHYPLVRVKYYYLLFLLPLLLADNLLQFFYIANLSPDIITSCCAVVFGDSGSEGRNLLTGFDRQTTLIAYYGLTVCLLATSTLLIRHWQKVLAAVHGVLWLIFFSVAILSIITIFSSYIYAMPFHSCPFCILKPEYGYIGFAIYGTLIIATFSGISAPLVELFKNQKGLLGVVRNYQKQAVFLSLVLLIIFTLLSSFHLLRYSIFGGEY
jgi:hypothetical protein